MFATIAVHAFSEENGINYTMESVFLNMMEDSFKVLHELKIIDIPSFESIFVAKNNQKKKVGLLTSTIDTLPRSTYSLFTSKKNCYFVNLVDNNSIDLIGLKTLLKLVFDDICVADIDKIIDGCNDISINYGCHYHKDDTIPDANYNDAIRSSLFGLIGF